MKTRNRGHSSTDSFACGELKKIKFEMIVVLILFDRTDAVNCSATKNLQRSGSGKKPVNLEEMLAVAARIEPILSDLVVDCIRRM